MLRVYDQFDHGVYDGLDVDNAKAVELMEGWNIDILPRGGYEMRKGFEVEHDTSDDTVALGSIFQVIPKPGATGARDGHLAVHKDGTTWKIAKMATDGNHVHKANIANLENEGFTYKMGHANSGSGIAYFVDGTDYYQYPWTTSVWAGVTFHASSITTEIEGCEGLFEYHERMYAFGNDLYPNTIFFAEMGDPTYYIAGNEINAPSDLSWSDDSVIALTQYNEGLIVFQEHSINVWYGYDPDVDMQLYQLNANTGTYAPDSVLHVGEEVLFLGEDSIYALRTVDKNLTAVVDVTPGLKEHFKDEVDKWGKAHARAYYKDGKYFLCVDDSASGSNTTTIVVHVNLPYRARDQEEGYRDVYPCTLYDKAVNEWYEDAAENTYCTLGSYIYTPFTGYHDEFYGTNTAIAVSVRHRCWLTNRFLRYKIKSLLLLARQYSSELDCEVDFTMYLGPNLLEATVDFGSYSGWDVGEWGSSYWDFDDIVKKEIKIGEKADRVDFKLEHAVIDEPFLFYGFGVVFKRKKPKGGRDGITYI